MPAIGTGPALPRAPAPAGDAGQLSAPRGELSAAGIVVGVSRPPRVIGISIDPAARLLPARPATLVVQRASRIASPTPENRHGDDGDDPDDDADDEEGTHDDYHRADHGYIQPRGR